MSVLFNREAVYAALFSTLSATVGLVTRSRRLLHWNDVPAGQQPALFMAQKSEIAKTDSGKPTVWTLTVDIYVYVRTDGGLPPGPILNPLLDAIEAAVSAADPLNRQTLGGLVHYARIDGAIETDEGTLGDQAVAIIPITILV